MHCGRDGALCLGKTARTAAFLIDRKKRSIYNKKSIQKGKRGQKHMARRMNRRKKAGRHLRIGRVIVALGLLACSLFFLGRYIVQAIQIQQINRQNQALLMQTSAPTASPTPAAALRIAAKAPTIAPATPIAARAATPSPSPTQVPRVLARYQKLVEKNSDTVGWLKVNCIAEINFAVVQRDNSFYMTRDFNGQMNMNGAPFLDEYCSISPRDDNLLIYGHNMKNGQMFGKLRQMNSWEKLSANPFVPFDTIYETGTYVPIAMLPCSIIPATDYFRFYIRNFSGEKQFNEFIQRARELSEIHLTVDAQYGDRLLTLVTCYDDAHNQRYIVLLRALREGETEDQVVQKYFRRWK